MEPPIAQAPKTLRLIQYPYKIATTLRRLRRKGDMETLLELMLQLVKEAAVFSNAQPGSIIADRWWAYHDSGLFTTAMDILLDAKIFKDGWRSREGHCAVSRTYFD